MSTLKAIQITKKGERLKIKKASDKEKLPANRAKTKR
jgi:hypothetical protein